MSAIVRCREGCLPALWAEDGLSKFPPLCVILAGHVPASPARSNRAPEHGADKPSQRAWRATVSMAPGINGFLLLDTGLNLMAANDPALQILSFPSDTDRIKQPKVFLADRVRNTLRDQRHQNGSAFVKEFKSGKRRYICKSFRLDYDGCHSGQPVFAVLLERDAAGSVLAEISQQFDLTQRERETVDFLLQGFTSKEIAARMHISPN